MARLELDPRSRSHREGLTRNETRRIFKESTARDTIESKRTQMSIRVRHSHQLKEIYALSCCIFINWSICCFSISALSSAKRIPIRLECAKNFPQQLRTH